MPREPRNRDDEDEPENFWKGLGRDALIAVIIVALFLGGLYLYAGVWPPLVVVESSSMEHGSQASSLGVIDTGDMVFQQVVSTRSAVITYVEGRASGYMTYGDYGDVIIFRRVGTPTPIIHRAIMFVTLHTNGTADVPDITLLPAAEWSAQNGTGATRIPLFLKSVTIRHMGFQHNINMTFSFGSFPLTARSGFVTMGDNNSFRECQGKENDCTSGYDSISTIPRLEDIQGRARGEIPWIGLIKLTLQPTDTCCPKGWGDPEAPKNSWDSLLVTLIFLVALPFILEYAGRGWTKFVAPHLPEIRWPWRKAKAAEPDPEDPIDPMEDDPRPPREGSSGP
jgi:signal peptidase